IRAVPGIPRVRLLPRLLSAVLRWKAFRPERRQRQDGRLHVATEFQELVPTALSVRVCGFPVCVLVRNKNHMLLSANRLDATLAQFATDVRAGLNKEGQKELPSKYFYDPLGSSLFEAITLLPEYGLTRADERILKGHAAEISDHIPAQA